MIAPQTIEERIQDALPGARIQVLDMTGTADHYRVIVVASQFQDKSPIDRHRMVYAPLKDVLGGELHALSLETRTPEEWDEAKSGSGPGHSGMLPRL